MTRWLLTSVLATVVVVAPLQAQAPQSGAPSRPPRHDAGHEEHASDDRAASPTHSSQTTAAARSSTTGAEPAPSASAEPSANAEPSASAEPSESGSATPASGGEPSPSAGVTPAPSAAPAPTAGSGSAAPAFAAVVAGLPIRLTGIVHAHVEFTQGVQSFDFATAVAPTSAVNPAVLTDPSSPNLSFQVQQTRLGMQIGDPNTFRAVVEVDFTHFDQSSPTVQAFPRIRMGFLEWQPARNQRLFLGQTWDIFGNATGPQLLSHSFNLVGTLFRAGNIGFMRQQLGWSGRFDDVEISIAAGMQGSNTGPAFNNLEQSLIPTGAARLMIHYGDRQVIGASAIATALRFTMADLAELRPALGAVAFTDSQFGALNLHGELYVAQNLAGTGALSLGAGRFGHDVLEVGGYLSGRLQLGEHAFTAGGGFAGVLNPGEVVAGYTPANPMGMPPTTLGALSPATGPGLLWNSSAFLGYWYSPLPGLSIVLEPYVFVTRFALDPRVTRLDDVRLSIGGRVGAMFQF